MALLIIIGILYVAVRNAKLTDEDYGYDLNEVEK